MGNEEMGADGLMFSHPLPNISLKFNHVKAYHVEKNL